MSYIINKTDGSVLTEVVDGTIDQIKTDITLVGKNATTYGELINENFVKILENFANTTQPNKPLEGQLWYDTTEARLKVYDGNGFKVSGGTIVSAEIPSSFAQGDIWIDSFRQQMYFNDGSSGGQGILAGPVYTAQQGLSGWQVVDLIDTNAINHTVLYLYVGQVLLGIFSSSTQEFTPVDTIPGYTGTVKLGFNSANVPGLRFNVPASQADSLVADDGSFKSAQDFLQVSPTNGYSVSNGTIRILNNTPLVLGPNQNIEVKIANNTFQMNGLVANQNFAIQSLNSSGLLPSMFINASTKYIGLYTNTPAATLDVNGSVIIRDNLTVEGNITAINQTEINIEDIVINLGKTPNPSNTTANGGGILLEAGTDVDKTFLWSSSKNAWDSSESFNIPGSKSYKISNNVVLDSSTVYSTSAPNLESVGTLTSLQVDNININGSVISFINAGASNGNITLQPKGAGVIDASTKRIANVDTPTVDGDATNKVYVDTTIRSKPLGFSVNIGALSNADLGAGILTKIFVPSDYEEETILRVYCLDTEIFKEYKRIGPTWIYQTDY